MIFTENKKCRCYVTYAFEMDEMPPLTPPRETAEASPLGFEPEWFLNAKFPEDEFWDDEEETKK